jgi:hypothetical protein
MKFKFGNAFVFTPMFTMGIVFAVTAVVVGIMAALKVGPFASNSVPTSVPTLAAKAVTAVRTLAAAATSNPNSVSMPTFEAKALSAVTALAAAAASVPTQRVTPLVASMPIQRVTPVVDSMPIQRVTPLVASMPTPGPVSIMAAGTKLISNTSDIPELTLQSNGYQLAQPGTYGYGTLKFSPVVSLVRGKTYYVTVSAYVGVATEAPIYLRLNTQHWGGAQTISTTPKTVKLIIEFFDWITVPADLFLDFNTNTQGIKVYIKLIDIQEK